MPTDDRSTPTDDRFDELAQRLGGFYLSWVVYLGLELGLFEKIRAAGAPASPRSDLATAAGCAPAPVEAWVRAAHASELVEFDGERVTLSADTASVLLDDSRPEYLGGQFVAAVVSSLDYAGAAGLLPDRPADRRASAAVPPRDRGGDGPGHRGLLPGGPRPAARPRRPPGRRRPGPRRRVRRRQVADRGRPAVPGDDARRRRVRAGLRRPGDAPRHGRRPRRPDPDRGPRHPRRCRTTRSSTSSTSRTRCTSCPTRSASLRSAWTAVRPGGRLVVLDWCLPSSLEDSQSLQAELLWGIQIDELFQGTRDVHPRGLPRDLRRRRRCPGRRSSSCSRARRCSRSSGPPEPDMDRPPPAAGADERRDAFAPRTRRP